MSHIVYHLGFSCLWYALLSGMVLLLLLPLLLDNWVTHTDKQTRRIRIAYDPTDLFRRSSFAVADWSYGYTYILLLFFVRTAAFETDIIVNRHRLTQFFCLLFCFKYAVAHGLSDCAPKHPPHRTDNEFHKIHVIYFAKLWCYLNYIKNRSNNEPRVT